MVEKGKKKEKYLISLENGELYVYGGIHSEWMDKITGEIINPYSIVIAGANSLVAAILKKKRMPIILKQEDEQGRLNRREISDFKLPYSSELVAKVHKTVDRFREMTLRFS
ncbi:MAG: SOS response-associated peptidase family protein [Fluviicola sp.]|nr:SOS response-associated peptidase family protein [Fluviicola sp.]